MRVNTARYLNFCDLKDLTRAYCNAYLQQKGVNIEDAEPQVDRNFNLGAFEEGHLIKTPDNSMFTLINTSTLTDANQAIENQVLSQNLHKAFLDVISFLIANNYQNLPSTKLKIGFCLNHDNNHHWTMLLANFEGLSSTEYRALYRAYQQHVRINPVIPPDGSTTMITAQANHVKNFLIAHKEITFSTHANQEFVPGNMLPIKSNKITLTHHDSLGDSYDDVVESAAHNFIKRHRAKFAVRECEEQSGATCGDWSVYNAMRFGLLNHSAKKSLPYSPTKFSKTLRALSQNITQNNAAQILYAKKPNIQEATAEERICVTQEARAEMAQWDEDDECEEKRRLHTRLRQRLQKNRENAQDHPYFNNAYPLLNIFARLGLGILIAMSLFWTLSVFLTINAGLALCLALVGCILSSWYLYDLVGTTLFGKAVILVELNDKNRPDIEDLSEQEGLINLLGIKAPYHKPLHELENEICVLLNPNNDNPIQKERQEILTHYFAQKIIQANPHCFYDADCAAVNKPNYVDQKRAKRLLRERS